MAGAGSAQERLDQIVSVIAADMVAEVCSAYVQRPGEVLELFATQGLKPSAVHNTRLRVGEGLVGDIAAHARPLVLDDAQAHPNFAYRPETGEEIYHSLMGVPILRSGRVLGVLVVQNRTRRRYTEEEVETLLTVAMVLAELVAGGDLIGQDELFPADGIALLPLRLEGMRLNVGMGMGVAVLHRPQFDITQLVAEDPDAEHDRLRQAFTDMHGALDDMFATSGVADGGESRDVLETYRMIAKDAGWLARIEEAIRTGLTAEAAVQRVRNDIRARMSQVTDAYLRERVYDFEDLADRLLQHLLGVDAITAARDLPDDVVVIARAMGPAQLLDYDRSRLRGLVLEEGSPTAHVAIVAHALDIPVVGRVRDAVAKIAPGDPVVVDGENGEVFVRPGEDVMDSFVGAVEARDERKAAYAVLRDAPAVTLDGERVSLNINAGLLIDLGHLDESGADGVGLFRTEIPLMAASAFPDVETQRQLYARVLNQAGGRPVVFRTFDVGGDKVLPYWHGSGEENPAMGWRALRVTLDRPAMLRQQIRALIRAAAGRDLCLMFPMVTEIAEYDAAYQVLQKELEHEEARGGALPENLAMGAMLEVPALIFQLPSLLKRVDFLSVGSNDLFQFLFASDRANPHLADRYDPLSPAVLSSMRTVVDACRAADVPLSLCGEMAGWPLDAMALVGLGFRNLSIAPSAVGPVKAMIRSLHVAPLRVYIDSLLDHPGHSVRENLRAFAMDHGVIT
jgi:phosphotransferase system enzyme I (PtsP)